MMVYAETPCDVLLVPKFIFYSLIDRYPLFKHQMLLVAHSRLVLQGIKPTELAPDMEKDFQNAMLVWVYYKINLLSFSRYLADCIKL